MNTTRRFTVVATEPTPNPAAYKFNVNGTIIAEGSKAYNNEIEAEGDPFAEQIFSFGVVDFIFIQGRFVSVTLTSAEEWELLMDPMIEAIEENLVPYNTGSEGESKKSSILEKVDLDKFDEYPDEEKADIIDAYMDETVRPALAGDGGGLIVMGVEDNVVKIRYQGACGSCSKSQTSTLGAIQSILKNKLSEKLSVVIGGFMD